MAHFIIVVTRALLRCGSFALIVAGAAPVGAGVLPPDNPNIILFVADDMGWGDSRVYNPNSKIAMPNLEQLANEGMRFTDAHTATAKCAPTRYTIVTGNYQWRGRYPWGQWGYISGSQILPDQWTIGDALTTKGYDTAFFGKMHLGGDFYEKESDNFATVESDIDFSRKFANGPLDHGFQYSFLALRGIQDSPYAFFENDHLVGDPQQMLTWKPGKYGPSIIPTQGIGMPYWDSSVVGPELTNKAIAFIDAHQRNNLSQGTNNPFFMYYASEAAHAPYTPPASFLGEPVQGESGLSSHADMIYELDVALGQLLSALEQRGLLNNTLVIFTSDNGGTVNKAELRAGHDSVGGLRGEKGQIWEGGHRVPLIVKWGDGTSGSVIDINTTSRQLIGTHDLMATLASIVGVALPPEQACDSFDFLPVLLGTRDDANPVRNHLIMEAEAETAAHPPGIFGYREGPWKLVFDMRQNAMGLYNLDADLAERRDLKNDPAQAGRIAQMVANFKTLRAASRTAPN